MLHRLASAIRLLWDSSSGYRLRPWRSPYLRWRIETYWGAPADSIDRSAFLGFLWREKAALARFLWWAADLRARR